VSVAGAVALLRLLVESIQRRIPSTLDLLLIANRSIVEVPRMEEMKDASKGWMDGLSIYRALKTLVAES
jgi:hypothetical protein